MQGFYWITFWIRLRLLVLLAENRATPGKGSEWNSLTSAACEKHKDSLRGGRVQPIHAYLAIIRAHAGTPCPRLLLRRHQRRKGTKRAPTGRSILALDTSHIIETIYIQDFFFSHIDMTSALENRLFLVLISEGWVEQNELELDRKHDLNIITWLHNFQLWREKKIFSGLFM